MAGPDDKTALMTRVPTPTSPNASKSPTDGTTKPMKKYGFRLTPEEQELAYELKANMMRKLDEQNEKLETEILLNEKLKTIRKSEQGIEKQRRGENLTPSNAVKLMRMYERKAKEGECKIKDLETELLQVKDLAKRYRALYVSSSRAAGRPVSRGAESVDARMESDDGLDEKVTEDRLDDDEAVFKRYIARLAETKSMKTTAPIRIQDIIRKNEVLLEETASLTREVSRLKASNDRLLLQAKHATADKDELMRHLAASEDNRRDLLKRLGKEQKQSKHLNKSLTRQATEWMQIKKELQDQEDRHRLMNVGRVSVHGAEERMWRHPVKKNVFLPRNMVPVHQYATAGGVCD